MSTLHKKNGLSGSTSRLESEFDPFGAAHGCNSVSAGLGTVDRQSIFVGLQISFLYCFLFLFNKMRVGI